MNTTLLAALSNLESVPQFIVSLTPNAIIDIVVVSTIIYVVLIFIKQTKSYFVLNSIIVIVALHFLSDIFDFRLTKYIIQPFITGIVIIGAVVFQKEIRRFIRSVTAGRGFVFVSAAPASNESMSIIADAVWEMAEKKIGAIIIIPGEADVESVAEGGYTLDGKISRPLILSIFDSNSPGHDGAMLIEKNRIKKFGLHLPLAEDFKSFSKLGTRHRAGAGVTERADAIALIVSEERGVVSIAENGSLRSIDNKEDLVEILQDFSEEISEAEPVVYSFWHYIVFRNISTKLISILLALVLWFIIVYR